LGSLGTEGFFQAINTFAQRFDESAFPSGGVKPNVDVLRFDTDLGGEMFDRDPSLPGFFQASEDQFFNRSTLATFCRCFFSFS